jgi:antitoxin component YwqK of YwqJK toxin-antitoxin module
VQAPQKLISVCQHNNCQLSISYAMPSVAQIITTISLPALTLFGTSSCSPAAPANDENKIKTLAVDTLNGFGEKEYFFVNPETGKKQGAYKRWSKAGKLIEECVYADGKLDQMRVLYFENGDTQIVENYRQGIFHGSYRSFYPNKKIQFTGQYKYNQMEGLWVKFYADGSIMEKVQFRKNLENGPFQEFYPDGTLKTTGSYLNGDNEHGQLKMYDETGRHIRTMECQEGICKTVWQLDGNK